MAYSYADNIRSPDQLKASSKGTLTALGNDVNAIGDYIDVLMTGHTKAQTVSPLGDKYFYNTSMTCTDSKGASQPRYVFINNIPDAVKGFNGLVPGIVQDLTDLNPAALFQAFSGDTACQKITLTTRGANNREGTESRYVLNADAGSYNACWFPSKKNPVTGQKCEGMTVQDRMSDGDIHLFWVGLIGVCLIYKLTM